MTSRLNARIDRELGRKVAYLRARTGGTTTEVVKASIEAMFERVSRERPHDLLAGFVGCASGQVDLSQNYKEELGRSLAAKVSGITDEGVALRRKRGEKTKGVGKKSKAKRARP